MEILPQNAGKKFYPVKNDIVFRLFFTKNKDSLTEFLKSIIILPDDEYDEIEITSPQLLPEYIGDKESIIDVKLHTKSRKIIHIEIQLRITKEIHERIVFYAAKLITEQLGIGEKYGQLKKSISIVITDDKLIQSSPEYHHRFIFYDYEAKIELSDIIEIHTLELSKLPQAVDGTALYDWAKFISAETEEELNMVAERNPQIKKASFILRELSADEQARYMIEQREKSMRDRAARDDYLLEQEREKWQTKLADKDAEIADKDAKLADQAAEIARLRELSQNRK
jgi:predicted transposase/invertase (TIGR01784 family)